jgi:hypothetical protein
VPSKLGELGRLGRLGEKDVFKYPQYVIIYTRKF